MKLRRLRDGDSLDGSTWLVRGGELDPETLRADATRYFTVYGCYGISVSALCGLSPDELAQQVTAHQVRPGVLLVAGSGQGRAVVRTLA